MQLNSKKEAPILNHKIMKKKELKKLLENAPVMSDEDYKVFLTDRKDFNKWLKR